MDREMFFEHYGVSSWLYSDRTLEEALVKIAGAGFRHVELWGNIQRHLDPRATPAIRVLRDLLSDLGLRVNSVHLPFTGMDLGRPGWWPNDDWLDLTATALEYCAQLEGRIAVLHVSKVVDEKEREGSAKIAAAFAHDIGSIAGQLGVRLALENLPFHLGQGQFGCSLSELAQAFPDEEVGFCLDTGHAALNGVDIATEVQAVGRRLLSVHANNNNGLRDCHWLPSQGVLNWQNVEQSLTTAGYDGCRVLEVSHGGGNPDSVLEQLHSLWQVI